MYKYLIVLFIICNFYNVYSSEILILDKSTENFGHSMTKTLSMNQVELREFLNKKSKKIDNKTKAEYCWESEYLLIPTELAQTFSGKNVLEIGCQTGNSIRAFNAAASISIVEPDINALSLAFDKEFTQVTDRENLKRLNKNLSIFEESYRGCAKRLNLDSSWLDGISPTIPWINDSVTIYPTILQSLPNSLNEFFNIAVYRHYNIDQDKDTETFFQRLSQLLTNDGSALIEFNEDEGNHYVPKLKKYFNKYFETTKEIIDEKGSYTIINRDPLKTEHTPNVIRFIILKKPLRPKFVD